MNRPVLGSLLGHSGQHSPARHLNVGLVAARWLPRPAKRCPSPIYSPKPNSQFPAAAPEPMNSSLPRLARVRNASPSLAQPRMLPSPSSRDASLPMRERDKPFLASPSITTAPTPPSPLSPRATSLHHRTDDLLARPLLEAMTQVHVTSRLLSAPILPYATSLLRAPLITSPLSCRRWPAVFLAVRQRHEDLGFGLAQPTSQVVLFGPGQPKNQPNRQCLGH